MPIDPKDKNAAPARVSPTAPASKSASANVWGILERVPGFSDRVEQGKAQLAAGERVEFEPRDRPG